MSLFNKQLPRRGQGNVTKKQISILQSRPEVIHLTHRNRKIVLKLKKTIFTPGRASCKTHSLFIVVIKYTMSWSKTVVTCERAYLRIFNREL